MSALLTSVKSNLDKAAVYLAECRAMDIPVTVADVNRSLVDFAPELRRGDDGGIDGAEIVFGVSAVRGVGTGLCELIIAERDANGAFADFYDFCDRVDLGVLNKKTVEALIKAGAFDSVGHPRQGLLMVRSEEHTSELQSLMRISYAVFCLNKKNQTENTPN